MFEKLVFGFAKIMSKLYLSTLFSVINLYLYNAYRIMLHVSFFLAIFGIEGFGQSDHTLSWPLAPPFRNIVRDLQTHCARADLDVNFKIVLLDRVYHCDAVGIHRNQTTDVIQSAGLYCHSQNPRGQFSKARVFILLISNNFFVEKSTDLLSHNYFSWRRFIDCIGSNYYICIFTWEYLSLASALWRTS